MEYKLTKCSLNEPCAPYLLVLIQGISVHLQCPQDLHKTKNIIHIDSNKFPPYLLILTRLPSTIIILLIRKPNYGTKEI